MVALVGDIGPVDRRVRTDRQFDIACLVGEAAADFSPILVVTGDSEQRRRPDRAGKVRRDEAGLVREIMDIIGRDIGLQDGAAGQVEAGASLQTVGQRRAAALLIDGIEHDPGAVDREPRAEFEAAQIEVLADAELS